MQENNPEQSTSHQPSAETLFEQVFENKQPRVIVFSLFENERPLKRAIGLIDWKLKGYLSNLILSGWVKGSVGEATYVPVIKNGEVLHLLLIGMGAHPLKLETAQLKSTLKNIKSTVANLKFEQVTISQSSFPGVEQSDFSKELKPLEIEFIA